MNLFKILIQIFFVLFFFTSCTTNQTGNYTFKNIMYTSAVEDNQSQNNLSDDNSSDNNSSDKKSSDNESPKGPGDIGGLQSQENDCEGENC